MSNGPDHVQILGQRVAVRYQTEDSQGLVAKVTLSGHFRSGPLRIDINTDVVPDQQRETLLHEIVHVVLHFTGQAIGDTDDDERQVQALGAVLLAVIRDNPELLAWLSEVSS